MTEDRPVCFFIFIHDGASEQPAVSRCCRQMAVVLIKAQSTVSSAVNYPAYALVCYTAVKGRVVPVRTMKTNGGRRSIAPFVLSLRTKQTGVISFTSRPLYPQGKNPRHPLDKRLGGNQNRSGRLEKTQTSCTCRDSTRDRPTCGLIALAITLFPAAAP